MGPLYLRQRVKLEKYGISEGAKKNVHWDSTFFWYKLLVFFISMIHFYTEFQVSYKIKMYGIIEHMLTEGDERKKYCISLWFRSWCMILPISETGVDVYTSPQISDVSISPMNLLVVISFGLSFLFVYLLRIYWLRSCCHGSLVLSVPVVETTNLLFIGKRTFFF